MENNNGNDFIKNIESIRPSENDFDFAAPSDLMNSGDEPSEQISVAETDLGNGVQAEMADQGEIVMAEQDEIEPAEQDENEPTDPEESKMTDPEMSETSGEEEIPLLIENVPKTNVKQEIIEWVKDIVIAVAIALLILAFFKPIIIQQESMLDTFQPNDYVITSRQAYTLFGDCKHGDVIVFKSGLLDENGKSKNLIKRIVGLPGDVVEVREDGYVYLNGEKLKETYIKDQGISNQLFGTVYAEVPEGMLFVMGDNRMVSLDSRSADVGFVDQDSIVGKVVLRVLPFSNMGRITNPFE